MITYQGNFKDYNNENTYRVTIITNSGSANSNVTIPIIDKKSDAPQSNMPNDVAEEVYFSPDPVHITCERSDLTQLIMITQCQIKLKTNKDMSDILFANTNRDIKVKVERMVWGIGDWDYRTLFYGYVDPLQFEQGYAHNYEEVTINATDPLGALEQMKIDKIDASEGDVVPVMNIIYKIFDAVFDNDASSFKGIKTFMNDYVNPNRIKVNLSVFYGESKDDYNTLYETLYELLKYLGCTICYEPEGQFINMYNLYNMTNDKSDERWFDAKDDAMDDSGSLSKDDAYSQIKINCEIEPNDDEIDLLDSDLMYSDYSNYQKYMTELISSGNGESALDGFIDLINDETTNYDGGHKLDHYCYVKRNDAWDFGNYSYIEYMGGSTDVDASDEERKMKGDQSDVLRWLKNNTGKAAFVSFGKGNEINYKDNSPVNNIGMTDYLVIAINGHNDHGTRGHIGSLMQSMQANSPICKYNGLKSINLTPTDKDVTNYIVISGKMILNPLQRKTGPNWQEDPNFPTDWHDGPGGMEMLYNNSTNTYNTAKQVMNEIWMGQSILWHKTVPYPDNKYGAYYTQKWWKLKSGKTPRDPDYEVIDQNGTFEFLDNKENEMLKYSWTEYGNDEDKISKLPILACQLKIGDKYCVEMLNLGEEGQGVFKWMTWDEWNSYDNGGPNSFRTQGFDRPYFTIGIDPKGGDKLVGHSFNIQNNISYTMNVDGTGTAIPISITDKLNGVPEFTIIGVINQMWNEIERVHPTMFRHTSWNDHKFWLLELLDSILISDLKIEFKSDNALYNKDMTEADNDLVYVSFENPKYTETLECDMKICTPLTMDECLQKGIKYQTSNSYVMTIDDDPFYGWSMNNIKPEQLLIDYLYKQYKEPARKISFCVDNGNVFGTPSNDNTTFNGFSTILSQNIVRIQYPGVANKLGQITEMNYYCMSMDWSLKRRENAMTIREILPYTNPFSS